MMLRGTFFVVAFTLAVVFAGNMGLRGIAMAGPYEDAVAKVNATYDVQKAYNDYCAEYNKIYGSSAGLTPGPKSDKAIADQKKAADEAYRKYQDILSKHKILMDDLNFNFGRGR